MVNGAVSAVRFFFFFSVTLDRPEVTKLLTFVAEPRKIPVVGMIDARRRWVMSGSTSPRTESARD